MQAGEGRAKLTVSVRPRTYDALRELSRRMGKPAGRVIDELVNGATQTTEEYAHGPHPQHQA
jgi:hypothetical protein